jgi:LacI family transcriptional regulator
MREAGLDPRPDLLIRSPFRRESGYEAMRELLAQGRPPAAVFAENDELAFGVLRATSERGLRVPEDVALVSFDGIPEATFSRPQLTTVAQPFEELGRRAVELALSDAGSPAEVRVRLPVTLAIGESCGCHRGPLPSET